MAQGNWIGRGVPDGRADHALAYDSVRGKVVLFGGRETGDFSGLLVDTWEYDGTTWVMSTPGTSPPARACHALAYDSAPGRVVLFGGRDSSGSLVDTWEYDGANWVLRTPGTSPSARDSYALAYDSARGKVVLFGGLGSGGVRLADTWEYDGTNWVLRTTGTSPSSRAGHALVYDSACGKIVLFGGYSGSYLADTWEYDGTDWLQNIPATNPRPRWGYALAYDSARDRIVLFGGRDGTIRLADTWEYVPTPGVTAFGRSSPGCTGPLAISANSTPNIGNAGFALSCTNAPPNSGLGILDLDGGRLSTAFPFMGIELWVGGGWFLHLFAVSNAAGAATVGLPLPNDPNLIGGNLNAQFIWLGPTSPPPCPPLGLSASNALAITIQP